MKRRIYVCHTYYHVYVTFLKELNLPKEEQGHASLVLSQMSTDFESLKERLEKLDYFQEIFEFDEKRDTFFPELAQYKHPSQNFIKALYNRVVFTKKFGRLEAKYIPVDFKKYDEIYVYCDSDPVGYYLNTHRIKYHAVEDGLNTLVHIDEARYDNRRNFGLKVFLSKKLNLIFVQNGYGKYCIDMEVNSIAAIHYPCRYYKEVPRQQLADALSGEEKELLLRAFVRNMDGLLAQMKQGANHENKILILTEPLCDLHTRERIFRDMISQYGENAQVYIKPHPRDELEYDTLFSEYTVIDRTVPMEMLNFLEVKFEKVYAVLTVVDNIQFAKEKIRLGADFMDRYEEPRIHRQNEEI